MRMQIGFTDHFFYRLELLRALGNPENLIPRPSIQSILEHLVHSHGRQSPCYTAVLSISVCKCTDVYIRQSCRLCNCRDVSACLGQGLLRAGIYSISLSSMMRVVAIKPDELNFDSQLYNLYWTIRR